MLDDIITHIKLQENNRIIMENENPFTLLIVDDEQNILLSMRRLFARSPYRLLFAQDGMKALDCLGKN
jgi:response regulator RpfG family c-di-GMP phosphodiesterase